MNIELNNCYNIDCLEGMRLMQEQGIKADWCITDPPYGIGIDKMAFTNGKTDIYNSATTRRDYSSIGKWDSVRLGGEYFDLMREQSDNQVIFGGNYYTDILPPTKSWLVWDKRLPNKTDRNDFADCELAWCSKGVARVINYLYNGMLQGDMRNKDYRFHPTQKPTQLWTQILDLYTKKGDIILDPFAGSQSLRIACYRMRRQYIGFELDKEYFDNGMDWFNKSTAQMDMFDLIYN